MDIFTQEEIRNRVFDFATEQLKKRKDEGLFSAEELEAYWHAIIDLFDFKKNEIGYLLGFAIIYDMDTIQVEEFLKNR